MMYLINYDLNSPGKDYSKLIEVIKTYDWAKICKSTWVIKTDSPSKEVAEHIWKYMDANDILFVNNFSEWWSYNLPKDVIDWLKS